jgi:hypothetical protein
MDFMEAKISKYYEAVKNDYPVFLNYLKAKQPLFHNANLFIRDFEYGVKRFLEKKDLKVTIPEAEIIASELGTYLVKEGIFIPINNMTWKLNYPDFITTKPGDPL